MNMQSLKAYALARAQESSTWRGLIFLATGAGVHIKPEWMESIVTLGTIAAGAVGALFPDAKAKEPSP